MIGNLSELPDRLELQPRNLDLNKLIDDEIKKFSSGITDLKIDKHFGRLPRVMADSEEICKVVHNLLLNACEAINGNGWVEVRTEANGGHVVFSVSDKGPGMARDFMECSLFQPFN